jgi:sirohydrochlorin cobaltochelatase
MSTLQSNRPDGLLLIGHGTRDPRGLADFQRTAALVRQRAEGRLVEACYLELAEPTIADGVDRLAAAGVKRITVSPLMLFAAGHVKRDIPTALAAAAAAYPNLAIKITGALECSEHLLALSQRRFDEALAGRPQVAPEKSMLLMVGRGSADAEATAAMNRFAKLRRDRAPVGQVATCFVAIQRPSLTEGLVLAAGAGFDRIVVQPHLLFQGQLMTEIEASVKVAAAANRQIEWVLTSPLGPESEVVAAVLETLSTVKLTANRRP